MSLVSLEELPNHTCSMGERGRIEYVRPCLGRSNNPYDSPTSIRKSRLCPKVGNPDPFDPECVIVDVQVKRRRDDEPCVIWDISFSSTTQWEEFDGVSPLKMPARITWHSARYQKEAFRDIKGKMVTTAAGTPLRRLIEDERWVISVEKFMANPPTWLLSFQSVINASSVTVDGIPFPKQTLRCSGLRIGERVYETFQRSRISYRSVSFQLDYRNETWKSRTPNVDWYEKLTGPYPVKTKLGQYKRDKNGKVLFRPQTYRRRILIGDPAEYPTEPWPLALDGSKLPVGYGPDDPTNIESDDYRTADFSRLPLK